MLKGTHDGNLITNQDIVGQSAASVNRQTWISASFKNYSGETIEPTKIKLKVTTQVYGTKEIEPTTEQSATTQIAHRESGAINGTFRIQDNELVCEISSGTTHLIEVACDVKITKITTVERTYDEFRFDE